MMLHPSRKKKTPLFNEDLVNFEEKTEDKSVANNENLVVLSDRKSTNCL